jgi:hypothetical protein
VILPALAPVASRPPTLPGLVLECFSVKKLFSGPGAKPFTKTADADRSTLPRPSVLDVVSPLCGKCSSESSSSVFSSSRFAEPVCAAPRDLLCVVTLRLWIA